MEKIMAAISHGVNPKTIPQFRPGDTVRVHMRVVEGDDSERIQVFEGTVIRRRGRGVSESFTVRKISFGVGVERTFPVLSPRIQKIELSRGGRARRARLYYLRGLGGKAARLSDVERPSEAQADGEPAKQDKAPTKDAPKAEAASA